METVGAFVDVASGVLLTALGVAVAVRTRFRKARAFTVFCLAFGLGFWYNVGGQIEQAVGPAFGNRAGDVSAFIAATSGLMLLVALFAAVVMARSAPKPVGARESRGYLVAVVISTLATAMLLTEMLVNDGVAIFRASWGYTPLVAGLFVVSGFLGWRHAVSPTGESQFRTQASIMGAAIALWPAFHAGRSANFGTATIEDNYPLVALVFVCGFWLWAAHRQRAHGARNVAWSLLGLALLGAALDAIPSITEQVNQSGIYGIVRTAGILLLAYGIFRYDMLGVDVRVRWTIKSTTLGAIFVAVFFVASELAQKILSEQAGPVVGILAAGALVFGLAPLQRFADSVALRAVPFAGSSTASGEELFRITLGRFLSDQRVSLEEERALAQLATRLGISAERAFELRSQLPTAARRRGR